MKEDLPDALPEVRPLRHGLGHDVPRAGERGLDIRDPARRIDACLRLPGRIPITGLRQDPRGQGLETPFPGHRRPGPPLRPVRKVEILEVGLRRAGGEPGGKVAGELALLRDALPDGFAARVEFGEILLPLPDGAQLHLVEPAGSLFAVTSDEGDRAAVRDESQHRVHLSRGDTGFPGDDIGARVGHGASGLRIEGTILPPRREW